MPQGRNLLLMSMALQGAVSLTFGLAFLGLWRGFHRPTAIRWAIAWLVYAFGVAFVAAGIASGFGNTLGPEDLAVLALPIQMGLMLFRCGVDSLVEPHILRIRRYLLAALAIVATWWLFRLFRASGIMYVNSAVGAFILPRVLMGVLFAWVLWPLRVVVRRRWAEGIGLMALALVFLSIRMFASAGYEIWQTSRGVANQPESTFLTVMQISLLIVFGVATALVLVEAERLEAVRAADTVRQTADALRASEARYRFVVEHASDILVIVDTDQRIRYVAPSTERLLGLAPSAFEGRGVADVIHADDRDTVMRALARLSADPRGRRPPTPVRLQHRSGDWIPFDVSGQLVTEDSSVKPSMVLSLRDVTAQRQLEEVLLQTRRLDSLGRMAGNVAHDFNNILMAITGGLDVLSERLPSNDPCAELLDVVRTSAKRGNALTRQLLTFARQLPETTERVEVAERLASLEGVIAFAVGRGIELKILHSDEALAVRCDPGQFDQVMLNLAINARDAMPKGGDLTIESRMATAEECQAAPACEPPCLRIIVTDMGTGIPPAILHRIFDPFFTTKEDGRGTGLGLASAYGFARQAGGRLSVESTVGAGTRFFLDLPLDNAVVAQAASGAVEN
jgi:PAS domain S-box-containing protein